MPGSRYRCSIAMRSCAVALVVANRCRRAAVPPCHREETRRAVRKERRDRDRMRKARRRVLRRVHRLLCKQPGNVSARGSLGYTDARTHTDTRTHGHTRIHGSTPRSASVFCFLVRSASSFLTRRRNRRRGKKERGSAVEGSFFVSSGQSRPP